MNEDIFDVPYFTRKEVNNNTRNVFGNILRETRETSKKTLGEIATKLGISEEECSEFETGKKLPDRSQLEKFKDAYGTIEGELESALDSFSRKDSSHHAVDRRILPTDPISRSGRNGPHQRLDNRAN